MVLEYVKNYEKKSIVTSILMMILAVLLIFNPAGVTNIVLNVFGVVVLIAGTINILSYIFQDKDTKQISYDLFNGIVMIILGCIIIVFKSLIISIIPIIVAIWIIYSGIIKYQMSKSLNVVENKQAKILTISAIIQVVLGVLILLNPFGTAIAVISIVGMILFVTELQDLIEGLYVIKNM